MVADAEKPRVDAANVREIIDFKPTPRHGRQIFLVQGKDGQEGYINAELADPHGHFWDQFEDANRPVHAKGMILQLVGLRNSVMRKGCIRSYKTQKNWNDEHLTVWSISSLYEGVIRGDLLI
ncbi:hypothetical protein H9Q71_013051 [Fusarium xylarioides]|nr:hypothetical protein H9Q71_013051 [Fusarium xylarioides]